MINLKTLLRLAASAILTSFAATWVVVCGSSNLVTNIDAKVSQNLGLTNEKGETLIKRLIDVSTPAVAIWKTDLNTEHLATKLVQGTSGKVVGKDDDSTAFLKNVLKLTLDADNKFNFDDVNVIVAKVNTNTIKPTIVLNTVKNDYAIMDGTFMLQFYAKDGTTTLGHNYLFC